MPSLELLHFTGLWMTREIKNEKTARKVILSFRKK